MVEGTVAVMPALA